MSVSPIVTGPSPAGAAPAAGPDGSAARRPAPTPKAAQASTDPGSAAEAAAIAALRKLVEAAQAKLERLQRAGSDDQALQGARLELAAASSALADAVAGHARRARELASASGGVDTFA